LAEGDFNGDKIPDLAVGASGFAPRILLGKGDGTFTITACLPSLQVYRRERSRFNRVRVWRRRRPWMGPELQRL
jgi:hypothetical protein